MWWTSRPGRGRWVVVVRPGDWVDEWVSLQQQRGRWAVGRVRLQQQPDQVLDLW